MKLWWVRAFGLGVLMGLLAGATGLLLGARALATTSPMTIVMTPFLTYTTPGGRVVTVWGGWILVVVVLLSGLGGVLMGGVWRGLRGKP